MTPQNLTSTGASSAPKSSRDLPPACLGMPKTEPHHGSLAQCPRVTLWGRETPHLTLSTPSTAHAHDGATTRKNPHQVFLHRTVRAYVFNLSFKTLSTRLTTGLNSCTKSSGSDYTWPEVCAHSQATHTPHRGNSIFSIIWISPLH